jgi:hypothetical protein
VTGFKGSNQFDVASFARSPHFPAVAFKSHEEFQSFLRDHQSVLDVRDAYELSLATEDASLTCKGTCAPCLRPTTFLSSTLDRERLPDGRRMPNWNEDMRCDCENRLTGRQRALIHFLQATVLTPWTHMLLFGPPSDVDRPLKSLAYATTSVPRLRRSDAASNRHPMAFLDAPSSKFHAVASQDYLNFVPPLRAALEEILRVLVPGGRFIFSIPFHFTAILSEYITQDVLSFAPETPVEFRGLGHKLGWDLITLLTQTGFRDATAYLYWSAELGYLGSMNFIFKAVK